MDHASHATHAAAMTQSNPLFDFSTAGFMPHGHCYLWKPDLLTLHAGSDLLTGFAYLVISLTALAIIRRVRFQFSGAVLCIGVLFGACGLTHFMEVWNLWVPEYWISGWVKAITAAASMGSGFFLFKLRHPIIKFVEAARKADANRISLEESTFDLISRENTLRSFFDSAPMMMGVIDVEGSDIRLISANQNTAEFFGRTTKQITGALVNELGISAESVKLWSENLEEADRTKKPVRFEYQVMFDQEPRWYSVAVSRIGQSPKGLSRFSFISQDITEKHLAEAHLRGSRDLLERDKKRLEVERDRLFQLPNHLLCMIDEPGVFRDVNYGFTNVLGFKREELVGQSIWGFVHPEDVTKSIEAVRLAQISVVHAFENRVLSKAGSYRWLRWTGTGVEGTIYCAATDVTELKELEQSLKVSEERFRSVANSIPQLAWITDAMGTITWYNQRWLDYTGTQFERAQRWERQTSHHPDHIERVTEKWRRHLATGQFWEDTFPLRGKDGTYRWFLSRASAVRDDKGRVIQWFGTNTDITDQLRVERELIESKEAAEKANLAKTQFLANMSHEIRTPLGVIMGFSDLLKNPNLGPGERASFTNIIDRNSAQLMHLIDDVLDLSKVEAGKLSIEKRAFSLREFLKDFESVMRLKAHEKGIEFTLDCNGEVPEEIVTDSTRLRQILSNIVGNAIKFTETGKVEMKLRLFGSYLDITVTDTGIGIQPDHLANLFKPFGQADPSLTRKFGGTGLGLILSKRLATSLGGDLTLEWTKPGVGSRFHVRIEASATKTVKAATTPSATATSTLFEEHATRLSGLHILVVEDSPDNRTLVLHYLRKTGTKISTADNGLQGVEKTLAENPDIVLMDIQMPELDGRQATNRLRALGFKKPIIALTAHAMKEERDRCFECGCNDYLTKPLSRESLITTLLRYVPEADRSHHSADVAL